MWALCVTAIFAEHSFHENPRNMHCSNRTEIHHKHTHTHLCEVSQQQTLLSKQADEVVRQGGLCVEQRDVP